MAGIHERPGFEIFSKCDHEELTEEQRRNKEWLRIGSPATSWKPKALERCAPTSRISADWWIGGFPWYYGKEVPTEISTLILQWNEMTHSASSH